MSRKSSFEDALKQKLTELPLPDENASWQQMNALLNKKERRRGFFFLNGKVLGGALLLCTLTGGWLLFSQQKTTGSVKVKDSEKEITEKTNQRADADAVKTGTNQKTGNKQEPVTSTHQNATPDSSGYAAHSSTALAGNYFSPEKKTITALKHNRNKAERKASADQITDEETGKENPRSTDNTTLQNEGNKTIKPTLTEQNQQALITGSSSQVPGTTAGIGTSSSVVISNSQSTIAPNGNLSKADSTSTAAHAKTSIKVMPRSTWFMDAGTGIKQQLPIDDQKLSAYNYNGSKSWPGDYIPFLYARLEKENKWFLQGEFHYAAPRLVKDIPYRQQTKVDYSHSTADKDIYHLQKTWYHEVPLSLNVYVRPSWSAGAGAMYSFFYGAAANKVTSTYDAASGQYHDNSIQLHWRGYTDSFLYKTNTSFLLQTNYQVNRWSFGIRYLHDLHPFVTYTLPDGIKKDVRNSSLELMIRYRFYRSHNFRIGKL